MVTKPSTSVVSPGRYEFKYRVDEATASRIEAMAARMMPPDKHSTTVRGGQYLIRSLYFDTPQLHCYHSKLAGIWGRLKVRLRSYGPTNSPDVPVFLELKRKRGPLVHKSRLILPPEAPLEGRGEGVLRWLRANWRPGDHSQDRGVWRALCWPGLRGVVLVTYWRRAFQMAGSGRARLTLDRRIAGRSTNRLLPYRDGLGLRPALGDRVVVEIKFNGHVPTRLQQLVQHFELETEAISKYTHCMDASAPLFESRRHAALVDEGLFWPATTLLYETPRGSR